MFRPPPRSATSSHALRLAESVPPKPLTELDLPLLRDPVLHLPNIMEVHGASGFDGLGEYMLRSLPLLGGNQYILLPTLYRQTAVELLRYFRELGLTRADADHLVFYGAAPDAQFVSALLDDHAMLEKLRRLPVQRLEPFIATPRARELAECLGLHMDMAPEVADLLNHKPQARQCFEVRGMKTPGGLLVRRDEGSLPERVTMEVQRLLADGYRTCALTLPSSFSGIGIRRVASVAEAQRVLHTHFADVPELLVEPWLPGVTGSPSFVLYLSDDCSTDRVIATTEQWLSDEPDDAGTGPRHFGNLLPSPRDLSGVIERAADVLRDVGVRGIAGVDLIARDNGELLVTEVNARQTGAIFGALTALRATGGASRMSRCVVHNNVPVRPGCTLAEYVEHLRARGLHYDASARRGVIVISNGSMPAGKVMVVAVDCELGSHRELVDKIGMSAI